MLIRYRFVSFVLLMTAVFFIIRLVTPTAFTQEAPDHTFRTVAEIEHWPLAEDMIPPIPQGEDPEREHSFWLNDWSKGVYQSFRGNRWDVYLRTPEQADIAVTPHASQDIYPRLNRGATRIVFSSNRDGAFEIYTTNLTGSYITRLTHQSSSDLFPAWSPDGSKIVFQSSRDGQAEVYVMNADGSQQTRLTHNAGFDGMPVWSPDGSKIAFASYRNGQYRIYAMNANGSGVTQLSGQPYSAYPTWSPDGTRIAYSADTDGDGWLELWVMDADGSNQQLLYNPPGQTDVWARSWSPDSRMIAHTFISFIYYQGNWYWVDAYLEAYNVEHRHSYRLNYDSVNWHPDWQTADIVPPVTSVRPLPPDSIYQFVISWSGTDIGPAGISGYDLQYKIGAHGSWIDLWQDTMGSHYEYSEGIGGETYYFRVRARDRAGNVEAWKPVNTVSTTIENQPPRTKVTPLNPVTHLKDRLMLRWTSYDPGGSGIAEFNIQYRLNEGDWIDWETLNYYDDMILIFEDTIPGQTYHFRVQGVDRARNHESWTEGDGDASTTIYTTGITGRVQDNSGTPVQEMTVTTDPTPLYTSGGDNDGQYGGYLATEEPAYTVNWAKAGYGPLPPTTFSTTMDVRWPIVLPPADNIIYNAGFESGNLVPAWQPGGSLAATITETARHTGQYGALLGQANQSFLEDHVLVGHGYSSKLVVASDLSIHIARLDDQSLFYTRRTAAGTWQNEELVAANVLGNYQLAVDSSNMVHVVWKTTDGLRYRQRPINGTWSTPEVIHHTTTSSLMGLEVAVGESGIVHVAWSIWADYDIFYQRRNSNGVWTVPQRVTNSAINYNQANLDRLVVDHLGAIHLLWREYVGASIDVFYRRQSPGGNWSSPLNVSKLFNSQVYASDIIVDSTGMVHIVWSQHESNGSGLYYTGRNHNGIWSTPYKLQPNFGSSLFKLILDDFEQLHLISGWDTKYHKKRSTTGVWSPTTAINPNNLPGTQTIAAIIDGSGQLHVIYRETYDEHDVYYTRQAATGGWSPRHNLTENLPYTMFEGVEFVADVFNQAHLVWPSYLQLFYAGPPRAPGAGEAALTQTITVPLTMSVPTLSFLQMGMGINEHSPLTVAVDDGTTSTPIFILTESSPAWTPQAVDLTPWAGQTVDLTFHLTQAAPAPAAWLYLDNITVGSAHPDVWVRGSHTNALRNEPVAHNLQYGNRGGAPAEGVRLTYTLPAELSFVSASIPPISTTPLVWDLGDLPAGSEPLVLEVVVEVAAAALSFSTLTSTAVIQTSNSELELVNNGDHSSIYIASFLHLPLTISR